MSQRQNLPPCCHALTPGRKCSSKVQFESELTKFAVAGKADGVQRLASDLSDARAALQLENSSAASAFQAAGDVPAYTQKLAAYLALVKGFTETVGGKAGAGKQDAELHASVASSEETVGASLRQPLVETRNGEAEAAQGTGNAMAATTATANDCSGCLNFCRWQDALTGSTVYALSARHEYAHTLLAGGVLMMTDARSKVDALLSERLTELNETQLKLAYQQLLHASGVLNACLESMNITPRFIGAAFADLGAKPDAPASHQASSGDTEAMLGDDMMAKWREEQRQAQQTGLQQSASSSTLPADNHSAMSAAPGDLEMLKRVPDLADGHYPQLLAWIALAEAQELVVLRGVTREVVDFTLMAKLSMDISARYTECHTFATRKLPCSTSTTAERIQQYCALKAPYYQAISMYFQGALCMQTEDARHCAQAVADIKKAATLFEKVVPFEKNYESKLVADKEERNRVSLLTSVFSRSQQIINRDLDIVTHRNDSVYYEPIPEPEKACAPLSLVKATAFPVVTVSELWRNGEVANCLKPTAPTSSSETENQQQTSRGCCSSCTLS